MERHRIAAANWGGRACTALLAAILATPVGAQIAANSPAGTGTKATSGDELQEIQVTGFRESLIRAQEIKRLANSNVEAITLEDLGKFADSSISDALQRVPGVAIEHNTFGLDAIDGVTIRGLGPDYLVTTLNGRDQLGVTGFFGSGGRDFDYGSIPPEILGSLTVYKSPTASLNESGLAGEINMQTLRPLDYNPNDNKTVFGSVNTGAVYDARASKAGPHLSGVAGVRLFDNTLGAYVAAVYSNQYTKQDRIQEYTGLHNVTLQNADGSLTVRPNTGTIDGFSPAISYKEYDKRSFAGGVQWKPFSNLEVNLDSEYNKYVTKNRNQGGDFYSGFQYEVGETPGVTPIYQYGSYKIRGNQLVAFNDADLTTAPGTPHDLTQLGSLIDVNTNELFNAGANVVWKTDSGVKVTADYAHSNSEYFDNWRNPYGDTSPTTLNGGLNTAFDGSGKTGIVTISQAPGINISNPASYGNWQYFGFQTLTRQKRDQAKLDFDLPINDQFLVKTGTRYSETVVKTVLAYAPNSGVINTTGLIDGMQNRYYGYNVSVPNVSYNGFCAANRKYCTVTNYGGGSFLGWSLPTNPNGTPGDAYSFQAPNSYRIQETNTAYYGELDGKGKLFGRDVSGNIGLRAVRLSEEGLSYQGTTYVYSFGQGSDPVNSKKNSSTLFADSNNYWKVLPSANFLFKPIDQMNVRFGVAKTMSLPSYTALSPNVSLQIHTPAPGTGAVDPSQLNGGNLHLEPTTAWNYDLTTEYYTDQQAAFVFSLFYKDVKNLTTNVTSIDSPVPGQYAALVPSGTPNSGFTVSLPVNANYGKTYGAELGANQPFSFLPSPWDGFGIQGNYTYVKSILHIFGDNITTAFPGSSKNNINATVYYEKYGWDARLAYAYRDSYLNGVGSKDQSVYTYGYTTLDASLTRTITKNFEVIFSVSNLGKSPIINYVGSGHMFANYLERPRTLTLALRGKL